MPILYPGHHYLGPGNKSYQSLEPVDSADEIALEHDLAYESARNEYDIREADREAILEFYKDGSLAGGVGAIGLGAKYAVESVSGVLYPSMPRRGSKPSTFNQYIYGETQRALGAAYRRNTSNYVNWNAFLASTDAKDIRQSWGKGTKSYKQAETDYASKFPTGGRATNSAISEKDLNEAGPSGVKRPAPDTGAGSNDNPSKRPAPESPIDFQLSPGTLDFLDSIVRQSDADTAAVADTGEASLPAGVSSAGVAMDVDQSGSARGPTTGSRGGASGVGSGSGANTAPNAITWIRPSAPSAPATVSFRKSRVLYSYGYSTENIQLPSPDYVENITTPMALIPVDFLPFYLSEAEYLSLPFGSSVLRVHCTVSPLGTRTAFDVGATLSGTATSEYVAFGMVCEGLNTGFYGRNKSYECAAADPMKPTNTKTISTKEMVASWYTHIASNAMCVPQPLEQYFVHEWNRSSNPAANDLPLYQVHNRGVARMDEKVHQFLINQAIGQPIVDYSYTPKSALIRAAKDHFVPWNRRTNSLESSLPRAHSMKLKLFEESTGQPALGDVGFGASTDIQTYINQISPNYWRQIENYGAFKPGAGTMDYAAQPQLHVGIQATPQLNPSNTAKSYLNSACYWKVDTSIEIIFDVNSAFSTGDAVSWPHEVSFVPNEAINYTDGQCLFGQTDTRSGNIKTVLEEEDYDDLNDIIDNVMKM